MSTKKNEFKTVCVIGLGYVGLPTAAVLASHGVNVIGADVNPDTVATVNSGNVPIVEPELDTLVGGAVAQGTLRATTKPEPADAFIIAVPTPFTDGNKPDMKYVRSAAKALAPVLKKGDLVVFESTSPVGSTEQLSTWLAKARPDLSFPHTDGDDADVNVAHSPERVLPGRVLIELVANDRVVGGLSPTCAARAARMYKIFLKGECLETDAKTAELVKLSENAFRDVNIAFANELSAVCDKLGMDVWDVVKLANHHPRVNILQPGPGVGGHCIAVDPWFIVSSAKKETPLIQTARGVNNDTPKRVVKKTLEAVKGKKAPVIACLGLAYKADIDDLRESPAMDITLALAAKKGTTILAVEPNVDALPAPLADKPNVTLSSLKTALSKADVVVVLVDHAPFKDVDHETLKARKPVVDTRGIWR